MGQLEIRNVAAVILNYELILFLLVCFLNRVCCSSIQAVFALSQISFKNKRKGVKSLLKNKLDSFSSSKKIFNQIFFSTRWSKSNHLASSTPSVTHLYIMWNLNPLSWISFGGRASVDELPQAATNPVSFLAVSVKIQWLKSFL